MSKESQEENAIANEILAAMRQHDERLFDIVSQRHCRAILWISDPKPTGVREPKTPSRWPWISEFLSNLGMMAKWAILSIFRHVTIWSGPKFSLDL